jgi:hypothetical protein
MYGRLEVKITNARIDNIRKKTNPQFTEAMQTPSMVRNMNGYFFDTIQRSYHEYDIIAIIEYEGEKFEISQTYKTTTGGDGCLSFNQVIGLGNVLSNLDDDFSINIRPPLGDASTLDKAELPYNLPNRLLEALQKYLPVRQRYQQPL